MLNKTNDTSRVFSKQHIKECRVDRQEGDNLTYYDALILGHTTQCGTMCGSGWTTGAYVTFAYEYVVNENKEWLNILLIKANKECEWSIEEERIPTDLLVKRPRTIKELENVTRPGEWLGMINNIWCKLTNKKDNK